MKRTLLTDGWQFRRKVNPFAELGGESEPYVDVTVPHDAAMTRARDPEGQGAVAYFPGGAYQYRRTLVPTDAQLAGRLMLEFEGVYRDAVVTVNGEFAGQRPYGYSVFTVDVSEFVTEGPNEIVVESRSHQDSRWYSGAGIHRNVWLLSADRVHIAPDGLRVSTPDIDDSGAVVEVEVTVVNSDSTRRTVDVHALITAPGGGSRAGGVATVTVPAAASVVTRQRLYLADAPLWSTESPALHTASVTIRPTGDAEEQPPALDTAETTFGVRRLQVDAHHGLRVNGVPVKLRGACVHHDNGILGAAAFPAAEERRVRLLKEAGFNAIRASHNPLSTAMIEACDRLGMYVMDETFDVWTSGKTEFDYSLDFADWWERDVESLVARDFNHPSVILYSIGNEIPEVGSLSGALVGRRLAEKVRSLDPTRFVTNAVNGMLAVMGDLKAMAGSAVPDAGESGINTLMADVGDFMNQIGTSPLVTGRTAESFGLLDVAGMNYLEGRYVGDRELFPNRVIVGTETFPTRIDGNWELVLDNDHVIGDFTWTGWDYLGEVGIGRPQQPGDEAPSISAPYPWIAAWCGDLDLTGFRRPASYYREIVFGLRSTPYISVLRPGVDPDASPLSPWAWSDSIAGWGWPGTEGETLTVEVYSQADEVELLLNGRSMGRMPAGPTARYRARFPVPYEHGELVAVAFRDGVEEGRHSLRSPRGAEQLRLSPDRDALRSDGTDLAFVSIELTDSDGTLVTASDREVTVEIEGPAVLQGLGSADPAPTSLYGGTRHRTFDGRALAIVRPVGDGTIVLRVGADGCDTRTVELTAG
jgi:beta-galactosidase